MAIGVYKSVMGLKTIRVDFSHLKVEFKTQIVDYYYILVMSQM